MLRAQAGPDLGIHVRSEAPAWIFRDRDPATRVEPVEVDPGVVQRTSLDLDLPATLAAHERFAAAWEASVARETAALEALAPDLVVADVPPVAFAAAARAGIPAVGVANFSWDWILAGFAAREPRFRPLAARYREVYASAETLYRLPLHGDLSAFPEIVDAPLLVNRSCRSRAECRTSLGVAGGDPRRLVLVSSGGFGSAPMEAHGEEGFPGYLFVGAGAAPRGFRGDWIALEQPTRLRHEDVVHACDAVLGKTGYSTVAEALAHGARFLFLGREGFPESEVLERGLARLGCARGIPRADFASGRWRAHLDALFTAPPPPPPPRADGAEVIAKALLARLGLRPA